MSRKIWTKTLLWVCFALNAAAAVFAALGVGGEGWEMLRYYTLDSNLLGLAASAACALCAARQALTGKQPPRWVRLLKYTAACCLGVTFLVVLLVLAPIDGVRGYERMFLRGTGLYHHLLCPVLVVGSFLLFDRVPLPPAKAAALALIPTGLYAVVLVALNVLRLITGPYPFLRVYAQPV
ncbi:MAG: hypothetical protein PHD32_08785 [Eubacteriales bacterium]|nr:hypothetical protein [Eubacteriales bacterium]